MALLRYYCLALQQIGAYRLAIQYLLPLVPVVLGLVACQSNSTAANAAEPSKPAPALVAADSVKMAPANPEYVD